MGNYVDKYAKYAAEHDYPDAMSAWADLHGHTDADKHDDYGRTRSCALCEEYGLQDEMTYTDIGYLCETCFDDCKRESCHDFLPPEETQYINNDDGSLVKLCLTCFEEYGEDEYYE
jgi:hypothetical protein